MMRSTEFLIPRQLHADKPAVVIELKHNHSKNYVKALEDYKGKLLLVDINYDKEMKYSCRIEKMTIQ